MNQVSKARWLGLLLLALSFSVRAQDLVSQATIPVIGSVQGFGGIEWRSDVALRNDLAYEVEVVLTMIAAPGEPFFFTSLAPGQSLTLIDVSRQTFGTTGILSPLLVQTLAVRSVTVGATAYGVYAGRMTQPQIIPALYGDPSSHFLTLPALTLDEVLRTNIGLGNVGETPATLVLGLQRVVGRNIATATLTLPPRSLLQLPIESFFPLLQGGDGLSLIVEQGSPNTFAYASVIANATFNGKFVAPR